MWCSYLAIIGGLSIYSSLNRMKFWDSTFRMGNQIVKGDNLLALQYVFVMETFFFFINVLWNRVELVMNGSLVIGFEIL